MDSVTPLTPEERERLRALAEKATPGPWKPKAMAALSVRAIRERVTARPNAARIATAQSCQLNRMVRAAILNAAIKEAIFRCSPTTPHL